MTLQEKLDAAIEKGWTCNPQTGEVFSNTKKIIDKIDKINGYIRCGFKLNKKSEKFSAHQFIYYWATGIVSNIIDHEDGNKSNNKISNLVNGTSSENQQNIKSVKGYYWHKHANKWCAKIKLNNKQIHLGLFDTEEEARQAYLNAKKIYHPTKSHLYN